MIDIGFTYFRTLSLDHLDAALFTLSQQDFTDVREIVLLDNNSLDSEDAISEVVERYPFPVPLRFYSVKHGDASRTQSWSVNEVMTLATATWVFFTRADFLLNYDCLAKLRQARDQARDHRPVFVTGWCHQMGYDAQLSNTDALAPHSRRDAPWRTHPDGPASLIGQVPAHYFRTTDKDAGIWLMRKIDFWEAGGLNEQMVSWGYQQQEHQRLLVARGVQIVNLPEYLFHHQHHAADRDFTRAASEQRFARG